MKRSISYALKMVAFVSLVAVFSGCKQTIQVVDGELPDEFIPFAENYLGDYSGKLAGRSNSLQISMDGRRLQIEPARDLLKEKCESQVGELKAIIVRKNKKTNGGLATLAFAFDPNACRNYVRGRYLYLTLDKKAERVYADILYQRVPVLDCNRGHSHCWTDYENEYLKGSFRKVD